MIKYTYQGKEFIVCREYYGDLTDLQWLAKNKKVNVIGGYNIVRKGMNPTDDITNGVALINDYGTILDVRVKLTPTPGEIKHGVIKGTKDIRPLNFHGIKILPIICYEICFPRLWLRNLGKIDFITHHVGSSMFDVFQYEGWRALEEVLSLHYNCDVVVSCGGESDDPMNLTGIVHSERKLYDYSKLYEKFDPHNTMEK